VSLTYFEAKAANGPKVVEWIENSGYMPERPEQYDPAMARNFRKWRNGSYPPVEAVDKVCILLGICWFELPDDIWADATPQDFPPRACSVCGKDMPRSSRMKGNQDGVWDTRETYNEYISKKTCGPECGKEAGRRSREAKHRAKVTA
jgi:hypothetical protein